jgi:hypothetical protein
MQLQCVDECQGQVITYGDAEERDTRIAVSSTLWRFSGVALIFAYGEDESYRDESSESQMGSRKSPLIPLAALLGHRKEQ